MNKQTYPNGMIKSSNAMVLNVANATNVAFLMQSILHFRRILSFSSEYNTIGEPGKHNASGDLSGFFRHNSSSFHVTSDRVYSPARTRLCLHIACAHANKTGGMNL